MCTASVWRKTGPDREQAVNGNGITLDTNEFGG